VATCTGDSAPSGRRDADPIAPPAAAAIACGDGVPHHDPSGSRHIVLIGGFAAAAEPSRARASRGSSHREHDQDLGRHRDLLQGLGAGRPVVFSHGWPLNADAWDDQMLFLAAHGLRTIAHDRRGHGRSSQPWSGNDLDTYADDLAALIETLDLGDAILVGHSTGGGEVTRYIGRHGTRRVAKAVLVGAIPPLMLKTSANLPLEVFDDIRAGVAGDRSQFYKDLSAPFYGANRPGSKVSQGVGDAFWLWSMQVGLKGAYDCIKAFSETDLTDDLKKIDVPMLIIHGDDDQIVPIGASAMLSSKIVRDAQLKVYPGAPHGLATTHKDQLNADLLDFIQG
jgi:non-heme chloroperoxidase